MPERAVRLPKLFAASPASPAAGISAARAEASGSAPSALLRALPALRDALARRCLAAFVLRTCPGYRMGWAHEDICAALDAFLDDVLARRSPRLMLCLPPRHGKSELASRRFPAFAFGRCPDLSVIATSYAADLAVRLNRDVQRIMDDPAYRAVFPGVRPGGAARNADLFEIAGRSGSYRAAGVGGGITGMGGDILIVDDPFKDRAEADSPVVRRRVWDWYTSTLYTRLSPGGGILLINTRWHTDDLAGRLLEARRAGRGDPWRVISLPALAEVDEPRRKAGEALHPERFSRERLARIKRALGTRDWEALYQQRPAPDGGAIFQAARLRFWRPGRLPERFDQLLISWDMTFGGGAGADYVVGQVWGRLGAERWLLDQIRRRMGFSETLAAFQALADRWPGARRILVENTANGPAVIDALRRRAPGIVPITPHGSKTARAHAVTALFEAGNVLLPHPDHCPWAADYLAELTAFPAAPHDDQVDATTQALRDMEARAPLRLPPELGGGEEDVCGGGKPFVNKGFSPLCVRFP